MPKEEDFFPSITLDDIKAEIKSLTAQAEQDKQKVLFADAIINSKNTFSIWDLAKILRYNGYHTNERKLTAELHERGYLMKGGSHKNIPTSNSTKMGLMEIFDCTTYHSDGKISVKIYPRITGKGLIFFVNLFLSGLKGGDEN